MTVFAYIFTIFCALVLPLGAAIVFSLRFHSGWKPVIFGVATFLVFQVLTRMPLIQVLLPNIWWFSFISVTHPILYSIFLGVTAGLFEEFGRYFVMSVFLRKKTDTVSAIGFGIGHGGIEAILLAGTNALLTFLTNSQAISGGMVFAGGLERLSAMSLHIFWSVLVMKAVKEKRFKWVLLAFILHSIVDGAAAIASYCGLSVWVIESALILCAAVSWVITFFEIKKESAQNEKN